jgi:hypothetical protein
MSIKRNSIFSNHDCTALSDNIQCVQVVVVEEESTSTRLHAEVGVPVSKTLTVMRAAAAGLGDGAPGTRRPSSS